MWIPPVKPYAGSFLVARLPIYRGLVAECPY